MPFFPGPAFLRARRRAIAVLALAPCLVLSGLALFILWPWKPAAAHMVVLTCLGIVLAEFTLDGILRIPFACSYLPGRSKFHITFWFWVFVIVVLVTIAAANERNALSRASTASWVLLGSAASALACVARAAFLARPGVAELRYEEIPPDQLVSLELS